MSEADEKYIRLLAKGWCRRAGVRGQDADDIECDAISKAWVALQRHSESVGPTSPYLGVVVTNYLNSLMRKIKLSRQRHCYLQDDELTVEMKVDLRIDLQELAAKLTPLQLRWLKAKAEGEELQLEAAMMGINPETARNITRQASNAAIKALEGYSE